MMRRLLCCAILLLTGCVRPGRRDFPDDAPPDYGPQMRSTYDESDRSCRRRDSRSSEPPRFSNYKK